MSRIADVLIEDAVRFGIDPGTFTEVTAEPVMFQPALETPVTTVAAYCDWYNLDPASALRGPSGAVGQWNGEPIYPMAALHAAYDDVLTPERGYRVGAELHQQVAVWAGVAACRPAFDHEERQS